ncbi:MAG: metal-dependent hydrolase [Nanoarchaeota archaeon]|nr:metal-dependent hydrolase [Nanoarchaeota archaeon]
MDLGTHLLSGIIVAHIYSNFASPMWFLIIFFSLLPDLIGEFFYLLARKMHGKKIKLFYDEEVTNSSSYLGNSIYLYPYNFLHSLFMPLLLYIFLLPLELIIAYSTHLILDIFSHSKKSWGIMIFWPFYKKRFGNNKNWWEWKILKGKNIFYFNLVNYSIVSLLIVLY